MADAIDATNASEDLVTKVELDMELAEFYFKALQVSYHTSKDFMPEDQKRLVLKKLIAMRMAMISAGYYEHLKRRRDS